MTDLARTLLIAASAAALGAAAADPTDISGTVTSPKGPEAGVWVIAETTELPTKFARIVVTDEKGRYKAPRRCGAQHRRHPVAVEHLSNQPCRIFS